MPKKTQVYVQANELEKKKDYASAYKLMNKNGDDFYLLRLAVQTGPRTKDLDINTSSEVLQKLNSFVTDAHI